MDRGKEFVVPFLVIAVVLVGATVAAGWAGFFIALVSVLVGGTVGSYHVAAEVRREVAKATEEFGEQPFPFL